MKIYMEEPIPKACCMCTFGKKLDSGPWYTCFITGKTSTSITTERPQYCPIEDNQEEKDKD